MIKRYDMRYNGFDQCVDEQLSTDGNWVTYEDHEREVKELERRVRWLEDIILKAACSEQLGIEFNIQEFIFLKQIPGRFDENEVLSIYGGVQSVIDTPEGFK